jgi:hypothetical protein
VTVRLSPAEAKKLGITAPAARKKTTSKAAPVRECCDMECVTCGEIFTRQADEDRHLAANPTHRRYACILG